LFHLLGCRCDQKKTPAGAGGFVRDGIGAVTHLLRRKHPAEAGWYGDGCGGG
jgi:hypothetical protein